jgi:hypothetical protein
VRPDLEADQPESPMITGPAGLSRRTRGDEHGPGQNPYIDGTVEHLAQAVRESGLLEPEAQIAVAASRDQDRAGSLQYGSQCCSSRGEAQ